MSILQDGPSWPTHKVRGLLDSSAEGLDVKKRQQLRLRSARDLAVEERTFSVTVVEHSNAHVDKLKTRSTGSPLWQISREH